MHWLQQQQLAVCRLTGKEFAAAQRARAAEEEAAAGSTEEEVTHRARRLEGRLATGGCN